MFQQKAANKVDRVVLPKGIYETENMFHYGAQETEMKQGSHDGNFDLEL